MHKADLNQAVQTGLAWYYLLCAVLNVGAALYWVFWGRGKAMLAFEEKALLGVGLGFGLVAVASVMCLWGIVMIVIRR